MKLGIGSYAFSWAIGAPGHPVPIPLTAHELLDKAAALNVRLVQIDDNLPLHTLRAGDIDALARHASDASIALEIGTRGIQPGLLREYLALAIRLESPIVRTLLDTSEHKPSPEEVVVTLKEIVPDFASAGIKLAIENHDRFDTRTLAEIIERINNSSVGVCLDTVNSIGSMEGLEVVVDVLGPLCLNLHIKDFRIRRAKHMMGFSVEGTPAGQGMLDIPRLLDLFSKHSYNPNAVLELWPPPEPELAATIAKENQWVKESVMYLRQYLAS